MKKLSLISLMILLIVNSFISPLAASANAEQVQNFTAEIQVDQVGKATLAWNFVAGAGSESDKTYSLQTQYKFDAEQTGDLLIDGTKIGTFTISVDGLVTATILAGQATSGSGSVEVTGLLQAASEVPESEEMDDELPHTSTFAAGVLRNIPVNSMVFSLKIDGVELDKDSAKTMELEKGQKSRIDLTFRVDLSELYVAGDSFKFELPKSILDFGNFSGTVQTEPGDPEFTYKTNGNIVTVILNKDLTPVQTNSNHKITMNFESGFTLLGDNLEQDITIPENNSLTNYETIKLTFKPSTSNKKMSKASKGFKIVNGDRIIEWEIWVNEAGKQLTNATVSDVPASLRHEIVSGSVQVAQYDVGLNGVIESSETTYLTNKNFADIVLNGNHAYKITYKTKVIAESPDGNQSFTNTATLTNGSSVEKATGSQTILYGKALEKNKTVGTNNNYESNWEIKYNYNLAKILAPTGEGFNIKDTFPGPQNIDINSIKVFRMDATNGTVTAGTGTLVPNNEYTITPITNIDSDAGVDGFVLKFNNDITDAYRITYKAKYENDNSDQQVFYTGQNDGELTNSVTNGKTTIKSKHGVYQGILTKNYTLDLNEQKLTWTIKITADNAAISGLTIEDLFTEGVQTLTGANPIDGITVTGMTGHKVVLKEDDPSKGFILTGGNIAKGSTAKITYTTDYAIETAGVVAKKYTNTATAYWNSTYSVSESKTYKPATTTFNNGSKAGTYDYDNQEFTWGIKVNFNKRDIQNAVLKDNLGPGHEIVNDSFKIYEFTPTGGDDTQGTIGTIEALKKDVDYWVVVDAGKKSFELTIAPNLDDSKNNKAYYVEYKTKDSDKIIGISKEELEEAGKTEADKGTYTNDATLTQAGTTHTLLSKPVKVSDANHLVSKSISDSNSNEGTLTWTIDVNKSLSDTGKVILTDTPSANLMLISDSIQISVMSINASNGVTPNNTWVKPAGNDLTVNSDGSFQLNLGDLSKKAVQVRYKTFVLGLKDDPFENLASISYLSSNNTSENQKNEHESKGGFSFSRSSAFASSEKGSVKFQKIGKDTITSTEKELEGVKFQLVKVIAGKEYIIKDAISDRNGNFEFENIPYGKYIIKEDTTTTPGGYVSAPNIEFEMSTSTDILLDGNENLVVKVINQKINQAVKLTKVDKIDASKKLSGAKFTLHRADGTLVDKDKDGNDLPFIIDKDKDGNDLPVFITNAQGEISLNNLEVDFYYFEEIKAPDYYVLGTKTNNFEIKANQLVFTEVIMENQRGQGEIKITKVDASDNSILIDEVKFKLFRDEVLIDTQVTAGGIATFSNLPYGTYTLVETEANPDYILDSSEITIVLDAQTNGEVKKQTIENTKKDHSVLLTKYNSNKSQKLKGAIFELRKANGNDEYEVVTTIDVEKLTTNDNGEIHLIDLPVGKYQLIEIKAPAGYRLDKKPVEFEILENQAQPLQVEKTNSSISVGGGGGSFPEEPGTPPTDPNTPGDPNNPGDGNNPVDPNNPGDGNNSVDPNNPGDGNNPRDPNNPGDGNNPGDPNNPGNQNNPGDPNNSGNPNTPGNVNNPGNVQGIGNPNNVNKPGKQQGNVLPQTGEQANVALPLAGFTLILLGIAMLFNRRKVD